MKTIGILGSTGSIGRQSLDVIDWLDGEYTVEVLACGSDWRLLAEQARKYAPKLIALADKDKYPQLKEALPHFAGEILCGEEAVCAAAAVPVDMMIHGIAGMAGLSPLFATIKAGNRVAFANKESLVTAGHIVTAMVREYDTVLLPVDSEHSAIFQCLEGGRSALRKLILTASGGPFRNFSPEEMAAITPEMALKHPTWQMGAKVTIDSSTMMNKGLEVIEAHWLFDVDYDDIEVLIQPQSIIHSMVAFADGSFLAHLGRPDMRIPIQYALTWPERKPTPLEPLDFQSLSAIELQAPKRENFPLLDLAYAAGRQGGTLPAVMNAANELLVHKFLAKEIQYTDIFRFTEKTLAAHDCLADPSLEEILAAQDWARRYLDEVL